MALPVLGRRMVHLRYLTAGQQNWLSDEFVISASDTMIETYDTLRVDLDPGYTVAKLHCLVHKPSAALPSPGFPPSVSG